MQTIYARLCKTNVFGALFLACSWGQSADLSLLETPHGAVDGSNITFSVREIPESSSIAAFVNGLQVSAVAENHRSRLIDLERAPNVGDQILIRYVPSTVKPLPHSSRSLTAIVGGTDISKAMTAAALDREYQSLLNENSSEGGAITHPSRVLSTLISNRSESSSEASEDGLGDRTCPEGSCNFDSLKPRRENTDKSDSSPFLERLKARSNQETLPEEGSTKKRSRLLKKAAVRK